MVITPASPEDLGGVAAVHVESWRSAYADILPFEYLAGLSVQRREAMWREVLAEGRSELTVAWSTGVGRALWFAARERLIALGYSSVSLWVIAGNERAIRFYSAVGLNVEAGSEKEFDLGGR